MRFSATWTSFHKLTVNRFAGLAATALLLPVAVSCSTEPAADVGSELTSEVPAEDAIAPSAPDMAAAEASDSLVEVAAANGSFDTLIAAVQVAGLEPTLAGEGPYTIFAPTDEAFAALPEGTVEKLTKPENQEVLKEILAYHVISGAVTANDINPGTLSTVEGSELEVAKDPAGVVVNGQAKVVQPDVTADNGVIHVIDSVLVPPTVDLAALM